MYNVEPPLPKQSTERQHPARVSRGASSQTMDGNPSVNKISYKATVHTAHVPDVCLKIGGFTQPGEGAQEGFCTTYLKLLYQPEYTNRHWT